MAPQLEQQLSLVADPGVQGDLFGSSPSSVPSAAAGAPAGDRRGTGEPLDDTALQADARARPRARRRGSHPSSSSAAAAAAEGDTPAQAHRPSSTAPVGVSHEASDREGLAAIAEEARHDHSSGALPGASDAAPGVHPDHPDLPPWHHHTLVDPMALTPALRHYVELKRAHPDRVLLYRLGDFYECFFEDAISLSRLLELTLTGKEGGKTIGRVPMAGLPHHAVERYCADLVRRGMSVALCDQLEATPSRGALLRRGITRVLTPGTVLEEGLLAARRNNWLCAVVIEGGDWGLAVADVSTGDFRLTQRQGSAALHQELLQLEAAEVVWPEPSQADGAHPQPPAWCPEGVRLNVMARTPFEAPEARARLLERFALASLEGLGLGEAPLALRAAGGLLAYLDATQPAVAEGDDGIEASSPALIPLERPRLWFADDQLILDVQTRRNLELTATQMGGSVHGSLLWALDRTATAMGGRCLRRWIEAPLVDLAAITVRQTAVGELVEDRSLRMAVRRLLRPMGDLERLAGRAGAGTASARDLVALADGLERLPRLAAVLASGSSAPLRALQGPWTELIQLAARVRQALVETPPLSLTDGGLIHDGVDPLLDGLRNQLDDQDAWLARQEATERRASGNPNLRLQHHRSFGYYLAVSRARAETVPDHWIRRQTLSNEERFVTPELRSREGHILQLRARAAQREYELFGALRAEVGAQASGIRVAARLIAELDALASLAEVAATNDYCRPHLHLGRRMVIEAGRHPVVEQLLVEQAFTANAIALGADRELSPTPADAPPDLIVLTGPNASGKSCYLRQCGLLQLMAQIGSWIPARSARIGIADRIFTRVGAVDDLASGQSTFMVEMAETANILHHATSRSLVLLDEIGRGTATFDGLSIAWAVAEHLATGIGARTIFATHYHELNQLAEIHPNVANAQVLVEETGEELVFLHRVAPGGASRSYGIEAARLAGVPAPVLVRARQVLGSIENNSHVVVRTVRQGT